MSTALVPQATLMNSSPIIATSDEPEMPRPFVGYPQKDLGKVLLISNEVMHYRVPVYNYFHRRFSESGFEFSVIANRLQRQNLTVPEFELREQAWDFWAYRRAVLASRPVAVVLYLHLKDWILWPLLHWLKLRQIPFAFWTKGMNWDSKDSKLR